MQVKVWNDHEYLHREEFNGEIIEIPPHKHVMMESDEALLFKGQFYPPALDGDGNLIPQKMDRQGRPMIGKGGYKMIRIEYPGHPSQEVDEKMLALKCPVCGYQARSKWGLDAHTVDLHLDAMESDEARKKLLKRVQGGGDDNKEGVRAPKRQGNRPQRPLAGGTAGA